MQREDHRLACHPGEMSFLVKNFPPIINALTINILFGVVDHSGNSPSRLCSEGEVAHQLKPIKTATNGERK